jgi:hypothetical protein
MCPIPRFADSTRTSPEVKSADAQKVAFKRALKKLLAEKFVFGEKDNRGTTMLWFASAEENYR